MFLMACIWSRQLSGAVSSVEAINSTVDMRVLTIRSSIDTRLVAGYVEGLQGLAGDYKTVTKQRIWIIIKSREGWE